MSNVIQKVEEAQLRQDIPDFRAGDTVEVKVRVKEGNRERLQAFEGVVIALRNRGVNSAFTVRKISSGEGVERVFQTHSRLIDSITVKRHGDVRRAKLYYLRGRTGKSARIKENIARSAKATQLNKEAKAAAAEAAKVAAAEAAKAAAAAEEAKAAAEAKAAESAKATDSQETKES